jgi:hypothetical protein
MGMMLQTEFEFTLPCGYIDQSGNLHRDGIMRRATALDEVEPLADQRVRSNEAYLVILLLSRVVTSLGTLPVVGSAVIERLFATDFAFLQDLYSRVNEMDSSLVDTQCPACQTRFTLNLLEGYDER